MNTALWVGQIFLGVYFFFTGVIHFVVPEGLPQPMSWMYDLPTGLHYLSGTAEILAGLGLILPGLLKRYTILTPLAALGLVIVMVGAMIWHFPREEYMSIGMNVFLAVLAGFVAYGRWRLVPLAERPA